MSFFKFQPEFAKITTVELNAKRKFISGSSGITGSVFVFPNRSDTQKDNIDERLEFSELQPFSGLSFEARRIEIYGGQNPIFGSGGPFADRAAGESFPTGNFEPALALLLDGAHPYDGADDHPPEVTKPGVVALNLNLAHQGYSDLSTHPRNATKKNIRMLKADGNTFSSASNAVQMFARTLSKAQQSYNNRSGNYYDNFHCLNFFQVSQTAPTFINYPNRNDQYTLNYTKGFTIEFWIKPTTHQVSKGIIAQHHGLYAIAIEPAKYNKSGEPSEFKMIYHHTSSGLPGTGTYESLTTIPVDEWSHVAFRYGPNYNKDNSTQNGKLSIILNHSASLESIMTSGSISNIGHVLTLGAWTSTGSASQFNRSVTYNHQNLTNMTLGAFGHSVSQTTTGILGTFYSGSSCEIQEVRFWKEPKTIPFLKNNSSGSLTSSLSSELYLYLPFFYSSSLPGTEKYYVFEPTDSSDLSYSNYEGTIVGSSETFATSSGFGNAHYAHVLGYNSLNVHRYLKDFVRDEYPFLVHLSSSFNAVDTRNNSAAKYNLADVSGSYRNFSQNILRNTLLLPCDNSKFSPRYNLIPSGSEYFARNSSMISLLNIGSSDSKGDTLNAWNDDLSTMSAYESENGQPASESVIPDPETFINRLDSIDKIWPFQIAIDIPIIFYGEKIQPESLKITSRILESKNKKIIIKDDGFGNLYRANTKNPNKKNKIGQIIYESGLIIIQNPHLYDLFDIEIEFAGTNTLPILELAVPMPEGKINDPKNPTYRGDSISSLNANQDPDEAFAYISEVYLHDENLNIVGKIKLANPLLKKSNDSYLLRARIDL